MTWKALAVVGVVGLGVPFFVEYCLWVSDLFERRRRQQGGR